MITSNGLKKLGFVSGVDFTLQDDGQGVYIKEWNSASPQPSVAEIESADAEWQADHDSQAYARARADAYAPIGDQLDMQYHDLSGTTTWADHVAEIKARFPK